jgi:hypothetical protein
VEFTKSTAALIGRDEIEGLGEEAEERRNRKFGSVSALSSLAMPTRFVHGLFFLRRNGFR